MNGETRLARVRSFIEERGWNYNYSEEDGCGSIDFEYRGLAYHIWEFEDGERGVETNLRHGGRNEDYGAPAFESPSAMGRCVGGKESSRKRSSLRYGRC